MKVTIDTRNFNAAVRELKKLSGVSFRSVIRSEVEAVLSRAIKKTKAASATKIRYHYTNEKRANGKPRMLELNGKTYSLDRHYPDALWHQIVAFEQARMKEALRRRGLAKQSWLVMARRLGLSPRDVPGYVESASVNGEPYNQRVEASEKADGPRYGIEITNGMLVVSKIGGRGALQSAINGRVGYFHRNVRLGVFSKVASMAKAYPGMSIRGV